MEENVGKKKRKLYSIFGEATFFPQLAGEAERHGIFKPRSSTYQKFQSSLVDLMKYAKVRCKGYKGHSSMYQEDLDSTLDEDHRNGKYYRSRFFFYNFIVF